MDNQEQNNQNNQNNQNISPNTSPKAQGIKAGLGIALFFVVAFYWLGYQGMSIFLAAIAGVSGGCIVCWWQITDEPEHDTPEVKKKTLAYKTKLSNANRQKSGLLRPKK